MCFLFQAEDGIRDLVRSRGLGDVYKRQVYGGGDGPSFANEKRALSTGVDMVVCTPGRMIAHINMGHVDLSEVKYLVLDEADRMLDMGFSDDINKIIDKLPKKRQNLMFSATMPAKIREMARTCLLYTSPTPRDRTRSRMPSSA